MITRNTCLGRQRKYNHNCDAQICALFKYPRCTGDAVKCSNVGSLWVGVNWDCVIFTNDRCYLNPAWGTLYVQSKRKTILGFYFTRALHGPFSCNIFLKENVLYVWLTSALIYKMCAIGEYCIFLEHSTQVRSTR